MKLRHTGVGVVVVALSGAWLDAAYAEPPPAPPPAPPPYSLPAPPVQTLRVPNDRDVEVLDGPSASAQVILYFHGICGDPLAFRSWSGAAVHFGTLIALRGDESCPDAPGRTRWGYDHDLANRRVSAAIAAANALRLAKGETALDGSTVAAIGYSQGARRVEWLAAHFPKRYVRVAMIAGAFKPSPSPLSRHARFLIMAGAWDKRLHLYEASQELSRAGLTTHYAELPRARHGEYGPFALQAMHEGLDWLFRTLP